MSERRLRILCLHGYRQNDVFFREKTGSLRKMIKKYADLHYANAPHRPNVEPSDRGDVRGWWFSKQDSQFSSRDVTTLATGFDESVEYLREYIRENGPFDGILGFSQGASMAHLLLAKYHLDEFPFCPRFVILASGFLSLSSEHARYTGVLIDTPSLHLFGSSDQVVLAETSQRLMGQFPLASAILHDGGHFIPPMSKYKLPLLEFLEHHLQLVLKEEASKT